MKMIVKGVDFTDAYEALPARWTAEGTVKTGQRDVEVTIELGEGEALGLAEVLATGNELPEFEFPATALRSVRSYERVYAQPVMDPLPGAAVPA